MNKNTVKSGLVSLILAAANTAFANEARVATPKEIDYVIRSNDNATTGDALIPPGRYITAITAENKKDWIHQKELIKQKQATVLIKPVQDMPGYCVIGLDGFPQKYDLPADKRTKDEKLEKAEWILNLSEQHSENKFYFPCDLKVETPKPTIVEVKVPGETKEVSNGTFGPGLGYVHIFSDPNQKGSIAHLPGAELSFTFQPRSSNWYFGPSVSMYGNQSSTSIPVNSAATEGSLAGQLVLRGENNSNVTIFGGSLGFMVGGDLYHHKNGFGVGLELSAALMPQWASSEFTENSAYFINGNLVEGSNTSNASDDMGFKLYASNRAGLRLEGPYFFATPSFGFRTNFDSDRPLDAMLGLTLGYNPKSE